MTPPDTEKFRSCMPLLVKKQMNMREQEFVRASVRPGKVERGKGEGMGGG